VVTGLSLLKSVANLVSCYTARNTEAQAAKLPYRKEWVQGRINNDSEGEGNCDVYMPASTPKVLKLFAYDWGDKRVNEKKKNGS
jgi:hypothetical protein